MLNKLLSMVRKYQMISSGDRVICAVSGGADSVALLFALYLLKEKLNISLEAAHFNHHLRGEESNRDEAFVRSLCDQYDIPLYVGSTQVQTGKKGLEAAARDARYAFLDTLEGKIATAHTADDNAETVLMHMVRGTGLKGLGGISPIRGKLIRPMLTVTRDGVMDFIREYHLDYVEDSSNAADAFLRNRLRHHVMPLLKQENPRLSENLSAMAMRLRQDEEALDLQADFSQGLEVEKIKALPAAVRVRALGEFLRFCGVREPEASHIQQAEALLYSACPSAVACFPGGVTVTRCYDKLQPRRIRQVLKSVALQCPGTVLLPELGLKVHCEPAQSVTNTESTFTVKTEGQIFVRGRMQGDALRLPGGMKTVKKIFIDKKIPADCRESIPVVADGEGVLGIYGIGVNRDRIPADLPAVQIRFEALYSKEK